MPLPPPSIPPSSPTTPPFDPDGSLYNQDTFTGRLRHFLSVLDPRTLLIPPAELNRCDSIINDYKKGTKHDDKELWKCKDTLDACVHPVTRQPIPQLVRMAAFVPVNIPICFGMLNSTSPGPVLFWQWFNQSYNTAVNFSNSSSGDSTDTTQLLQSYLLAVVTSCSLAVGLNKAAKRIPAASPALFSYIACAAAGTSNIIFSRQKDLTDGAPLVDIHGHTHGHSLHAGQSVVLQTALSRGLFIPMPVLLLPHFIMSTLGRLRLLPKNPRLIVGLELLVITGSLAGALPVALACFPQKAAFKVEELEPEFRDLKDKEGRKIEVLYTNKGL